MSQKIPPKEIRLLSRLDTAMQIIYMNNTWRNLSPLYWFHLSTHLHCSRSQKVAHFCSPQTKSLIHYYYKSFIIKLIQKYIIHCTRKFRSFKIAKKLTQHVHNSPKYPTKTQYSRNSII